MAIDTDLEALYKFSNTILDSSGNGNDLTTNSGGDFTTDKNDVSNQAIEFTGVNDYSLINTAPIASSSTDDFSVSCWFKFAGAPSATAIFFQGIASGNDNWDIRFTTNNNMTITHRRNSGAGANSSVSFTDDTDWHHLAYVYDQTLGTFSMYIDGVFKTSGSHSDTKPSTSIRVGNDKNLGNSCQGKLDEVRFYSRAISAAEVTELFDDYDFPEDPTEQPASLFFGGGL